MTTQKERVDFIIENGMIVTMNNDMEVIPKGWLAVNNGKIVSCQEGEYDQNESPFSPLSMIDASKKLVLPGFINTHTHIPMSYFKGLADDLPLYKWLNEYIWPLEGKMVNKEFVYHSALHGIAELIRNGVVLFNDQYFHGEQTAEAAIKAGMRAVIGEGIIDFPVADYQNAQQIIDYTMRMHEKFRGSKLIDVALSPHAIYTCCRENLQQVTRLAKDNDMLVHTHLSESKKEFDDAMEKYHKTPTEYLDEIGFWSERVTAAHCVWLTDNDIEILAQNKVNISVNTESNLKLSSGFLPLKKCFDKGINLTMGTDGVASNNNLSIIEEMSTTAKVHKALNNDPTFMPAREMVKCATINAARALRKEDRCGSLETGKDADLITIDVSAVESQPLYDPYSHIVYNLSSQNISDVFISGEPVMLNRQLMTLNEEELLDRADYYQSKMRK